MLLEMPGGDSAATLGARRSALLRQRVASELVNARINGGLSLREVARKVGTSVDRLKRAERGEPGALSIDLAARIAPVVGRSWPRPCSRTAIRCGIARSSGTRSIQGAAPREPVVAHGSADAHRR